MSYCKKPCKTCPFRTDVKPFLHPERAYDIAASASNPYSDFICHNSFEYDGDEDAYGRLTGDFSNQKTCAGFLTLRTQEGIETPDDFIPSFDICYEDAFHMYQVYEEEWEKKN